MAQQSGEESLARAVPLAFSLGDDSGIDAGPSSHHGQDQDQDQDQDNHGHHLLQAQAESDEVSTDTDEG
jgi:hypothetical protein